MVGNAVDARRALEMFEFEDDSALIGEGATRKVYKINNVVYKVNYDIFDYGGFENNHNIVEYNAARRYADIPGVRIPKMELYGDVLAMEYIPGELTGECSSAWMGLACECPCDHAPQGLLDTLNDEGYDSTWGNIIRNAEGIWLIDMGH